MIVSHPVQLLLCVI